MRRHLRIDTAHQVRYTASLSNGTCRTRASRGHSGYDAASTHGNLDAVSDVAATESSIVTSSGCSNSLPLALGTYALFLAGMGLIYGISGSCVTIGPVTT
jgi:hypothetical protein